jgi:hypothetical protein
MLLQNLVRSDRCNSEVPPLISRISLFLSVLFSTRHMVAASEVSSILESRISGTAVGGNVEETGRVLSPFGYFFPHVTFDLVNICAQVLVMVLDVFGACEMSKVCSLVLCRTHSDPEPRARPQPKRWWNSLLVSAACA